MTKFSFQFESSQNNWYVIKLEEYIGFCHKCQIMFVKVSYSFSDFISFSLFFFALS